MQIGVSRAASDKVRIVMPAPRGYQQPGSSWGPQAGGCFDMPISQRIAYMLSGLTGRLRHHPACPACGNADGRTVDRKWFHTLIECRECLLLHRFPVESAQTMSTFYDAGYAEPGLTTELPDDATLSRLLATGFKDSGKDFTYHASILTALGLQPKARILDFGANWGYASWQFARAGFDVTSFEISKPRAAYGAKLGLTIHTDLDAVGDGFDAVYSSHVLEHTPNPREALAQQLAVVKPGGLVVAHTPNGSAGFRQANPVGFNKMWGLVHPVLLTDGFVAGVAGASPLLVGSDDRPEFVAAWDGRSQVRQPADGAGLFFVIRGGE